MEQALGVTATRALEKGEPVTLRTPNAPLREESICLYDDGLPPERQVAERIDWALKFLRDVSGRWAEISRRCSVELVVGFATSGNGQGAVALDTGALRALAERNVSLVVDIYATSGD